MKPGIASLIGGIHFGAHMMPERRVGPNSVDPAPKVSEIESHVAGVNGVVLSYALNEIRERFGIPTIDKVAAFVTTAFNCDATLSEAIAVALDHYWSGRYSAAAHLAIPTAEAGARGTLLNLEVGLFRLEQGVAPGRYPALDKYVEKLEEVGLDPDWAASIKTILLSSGMNLRNLSAHGFKLGFSSAESALTIRVAALLVSLTGKTASATDKAIRARLPIRLTRTTRRSQNHQPRIRWSGRRNRR